MTDATYSANSFLRTAPSPAEPPPALVVGPIAWIRGNLFSSPLSALLTVLSVAFLAWFLPGVIRFLFIDAVWSGTNAEPCRAHPDGACWPFIYYKLDYFRYGSYPVDQRWRVDLTEVIGAVLIVWLLWRTAPRRNIATGLFFVV